MCKKSNARLTLASETETDNNRDMEREEIRELER